MRGLSAEDKKWQQECDARTLAEADQIKSDPKRVKGAVKAAKVIAKNQAQEAKAMANIAKSTTVSNSNTFTPRNQAKRK